MVQHWSRVCKRVYFVSGFFEYLLMISVLVSTTSGYYWKVLFQLSVPCSYKYHCCGKQVSNICGGFSIGEGPIFQTFQDLRYLPQGWWEATFEVQRVSIFISHSEVMYIFGCCVELYFKWNSGL